MNESVWKNRFDASIKFRKGALALRVEEEGYDYTLDRWMNMQLGKMQLPGYTMPSKGERRRWHRKASRRRLLDRGFKAPVLPRSFFTHRES